MKENTKMLQVRVSPDLHYKVKEMSLKRGKAIQEILIELIIKEVKNFDRYLAC